MRAIVLPMSARPLVLVVAARSRMFACACVLALGAVPAHGANSVGLRLPEPSDGMEHDSPAKPGELRVPATQINRCPDGRGGVRLQDRPCAPVETPDAAAAVAATASAARVRALAVMPPPPPS
jgi:hypothetical protein